MDNATSGELSKKYKGKSVRIIVEEDEFSNRVGVVYEVDERWCELYVKFDGLNDNFAFSPNEVELADGQSAKPDSSPRTFTSDELYNAAMGDSLPTQWDEKALNTFLSLIGNCKGENGK